MDKRKQMIQRMAGFLIVFMVGFVLVSNVLTTTAKGDYQVNYNDRVSFDIIWNTVIATSEVGGCGSENEGRFLFSARLTNNSGAAISNLAVEVVTLSNGNVLQNADGGAGGAGAVLTIMTSPPYYLIRELGDGYYVDVPFEICLAEWAGFSFYVDVLGLTIGDEGPAGGVVFFIDGSGLQGMEAAPSDQGTHPWKGIGCVVSGADGTAVGTGAQNTLDILAGGSTCPPTVPYAAQICDEYSLGGFEDWFLPSKLEFTEMWNIRALIPGWNDENGIYWTSSEYNNTGSQAWAHRMDDTGYRYNYDMQVPNLVRPVREF